MVNDKHYYELLTDQLHSYITACSKLRVPIWPPEEVVSTQDGKGGPTEQTRLSGKDLAHRRSFSAVNTLVKETSALTKEALRQLEDYDKILATIQTAMVKLETSLSELGMDGRSRLDGQRKSKEAPSSKAFTERIRSIVQDEDLQDEDLQDEDLVKLYTDCFTSCSEVTGTLDRLQEQLSQGRKPQKALTVTTLDSVFTLIPEFCEAHQKLTAHRPALATAEETGPAANLTSPGCSGQANDDGGDADGQNAEDQEPERFLKATTPFDSILYSLIMYEYMHTFLSIPTTQSKPQQSLP